MKHLFCILAGFFLFPHLHGQSIGKYLGDEEILNAQTKQVNQFFRRFNGEEGTDGTRFYPGDSLYRDAFLRNRYLSILFDRENTRLTETLKDNFIRDINGDDHPFYLDFHGGNWFAEVTTIFLYHGQEIPLTLFLRLQEENVGSKWVITNVYFEPFHEVFANHTADSLKFLHPLSHELDFMNLINVFKDKHSVEDYAARDYKPDYLTLFIYEVNRSELVFKTVRHVKFHFFQVPGWYFELDDFNRPGSNAGWLISNLINISDEEKEMVLKFIYHE
jgi:ribosomal protein L31